MNDADCHCNKGTVKSSMFALVLASVRDKYDIMPTYIRSTEKLHWHATIKYWHMNYNNNNQKNHDSHNKNAGCTREIRSRHLSKLDTLIWCDIARFSSSFTHCTFCNWLSVCSLVYIGCTLGYSLLCIPWHWISAIHFFYNFLSLLSLK